MVGGTASGVDAGRAAAGTACKDRGAVVVATTPVALPEAEPRCWGNIILLHAHELLGFRIVESRRKEPSVFRAMPRKAHPKTCGLHALQRFAPGF